MNNLTGFTNIYADRVPLDSMVRAIQSRTPLDADQTQPFWSTQPKLITDRSFDVMEVKLRQPRLVNHVSFDIARFPHAATLQWFNRGTNTWVDIYTRRILDSRPAVITDTDAIHPQHYGTNHWVHVAMDFEPVTARRWRIRLQRREGDGPIGTNRKPVPYSLAVKDLDIGYRVSKREDIPEGTDAGEVFASSVDLLGTPVEFTYRENAVDNILEPGFKGWKSEPQPVMDAVVPFYLDLGEPKIIDRFFLDPLTPGVLYNLYWSNEDPQDVAYEKMSWTPIPRSYVLRRGNVAIPSVKARVWKFEFTRLLATHHRTLIPIPRRVQLFPPDVVQEWEHREFGGSRYEQVDLHTTIASAPRFSRQPIFTSGTLEERVNATEAAYAKELPTAQELKDNGSLFRMQPWHIGQSSPRWSKTGVHDYRIVDHSIEEGVAYHVGLTQIRAFTANHHVIDDTRRYQMVFPDDSIFTENTFEIDRQGLTSYGPASATSKVLHSRSKVMGIQFATSQTEPKQIMPDPSFYDPVLGLNRWDVQSRWHSYGLAQLWYDPEAKSVRVDRSVTGQNPVADYDPIDTTIPHPIFSTRPYLSPTGATMDEGGIESPAVTVNGRRVFAAARVRVDRALSEPLYLQIVDHDGNVVAEKQLGETGRGTWEWWIGHSLTTIPNLPGVIAKPVPDTIITDQDANDGGSDPLDTTFRVRITQKVPTTDTWMVTNTSMFDDPIFWEFTVDGGATWMPAYDIRNNPHGVLRFTEPGTQLRFRVSATGQARITSLQIRPWYVRQHTDRRWRPEVGGLISIYDDFPSVEDDPQFGWPYPIPRWWWSDFEGPALSRLSFERSRNVEENATAVMISETAREFWRTALEIAPLFERGTVQRAGSSLINPLSHPITDYPKVRLTKVGVPIKSASGDDILITTSGVGEFVHTVSGSDAPAGWLMKIGSETLRIIESGGDLVVDPVGSDPSDLVVSRNQWGWIAYVDATDTLRLTTQSLKSPDGTPWNVFVSTNGALQTQVSFGGSRALTHWDVGAGWHLTIDDDGALITVPDDGIRTAMDIDDFDFDGWFLGALDDGTLFTWQATETATYLTASDGSEWRLVADNGVVSTVHAPEFADTQSAFVITSPSGTDYEVTVTSAGTIQTTAGNNGFRVPDPWVISGQTVTVTDGGSLVVA